MLYSGVERRKYPRVNHPFLIYYYPLENSELLDLTQAKNISLGGLFFTTTRPFLKGEEVGLRMRFPGATNPVASVGTVIDCQQAIIGSGLYNTRLAFSSISEPDYQVMREALDRFTNR